jgi:hypothetical protein
MYGQFGVLLIKPEGLKDLPVILRRTRALRLTAFRREDFCWDNTKKADALLRQIYPHFTEPLLDAAKQHFFGHMTPVFWFGGENTVEELFKNTGTDPDPAKCRHSSLRYRYRGLPAIETEHGPYYTNGIHRCTSSEEVKLHLRLFFGALP